jgi:hypothetical protein
MLGAVARAHPDLMNRYNLSDAADGDTMAGYWPRVDSVTSVYGMLDREDSIACNSPPVAFVLSFLWRAHAGRPSGAGRATAVLIITMMGELLLC